MNLSLKEIAHKLKGSIEDDVNFKITQLSKIEDAQSGSLSFLANKKYPNFIKMDIEGHETQVFEGGLEYFKNNNEGETNILLEVHPQFYGKDNDFAKILNEYFKIGFKPKYVITTPVGQPKLFKEKGYEPFQQVHTDGVVRGIYDNISAEDLIEFACKENIEDSGRKVSKKIVRSFMIARD